jgi:hypothetical protein
MLHSSATVIQRYFRGFMTRLRTVDSIRKLQASCLQQRLCQSHRFCSSACNDASGRAASIGIRYLSRPGHRVLANRVSP